MSDLKFQVWEEDKNKKVVNAFLDGVLVASVKLGSDRDSLCMDFDAYDITEDEVITIIKRAKAELL